MALLAAVVATRVSYCILPLWRPLLPGTPDLQSLRWRLVSGSLCVCSFATDTRIQFWRTLAASVHRVSHLHSASRSSSRETPAFGFPFSRSVVHDRPMHLSCPLCRRSCSLIPWCSGTLPISQPIVVVLLWTSLSQHQLFHATSLSTPVPTAVHSLPSVVPACIRPHVVFLSSRHSLGLSFSKLSPPSLFAQRDWSTVVASCHPSLTEWHQSVLVHDPHSLPDFPERASILDTLFSSLTQILFDSTSLHSRRRPTVSRPRRRQPLWWNDACYHALVARNGSWRDFRHSESQEDQTRFRFMRQQFHSTVRASRTHFWNEWLGSMTSISRRAPRLASSLIRRTFRSPAVTPDLCHMQWHGASRSTLPPDEARSQWRTHFSPPTGDSVFSDGFFHSLSLRFASLTSLHESGRFDVPFSYNELVAALSKCHESAPSADCLPYSLFKVSFPWWRHLFVEK